MESCQNLFIIASQAYIMLIITERKYMAKKRCYETTREIISSNSGIVAKNWQWIADALG